MMLQQPEPEDYVVATGTSYRARDFVEAAFAEADLDWRRYVEMDPRYMRPAEVDNLIGDAARAKAILGWRPKTYMAELARIMVEADSAALGQER